MIINDLSEISALQIVHLYECIEQRLNETCNQVLTEEDSQ